MTSILALDTSTKTGWAVGASADNLTFGTFELSGWRADTVGTAYVQLYEFVSAMCAMHDVSACVIERPLSVTAHASTQRKNNDLAAALLGYVAVAECAAIASGVRCFVVAPTTVRKFYLGNGKPKNPKSAVIAECHNRGFRVADDNQADAISIWHYARHAISTKEIQK